MRFGREESWRLFTALALVLSTMAALSYLGGRYGLNFLALVVAIGVLFFIVSWQLPELESGLKRELKLIRKELKSLNKILTKAPERSSNPGNDPEEPHREKERVKTSGSGALGGMVLGGTLGLPLGPGGVILGGLLGAVVGDCIERIAIEEERRRSEREEKTYKLRT